MYRVWETGLCVFVYLHVSFLMREKPECKIWFRLLLLLGCASLVECVPGNNVLLVSVLCLCLLLSCESFHSDFYNIYDKISPGTVLIMYIVI